MDHFNTLDSNTSDEPQVCSPALEPSGDVVFIVNGHPDMRNQLEQSISTSGLAVISFRTAGEYLAFPSRDRAACLVLDVALPDINGLDLHERIASTCAPVVFVTRQASIASSVRALKCGAVDFLPFPLQREELLHSVHAAVARNGSRRIELRRFAEL